jgi:hypothetical protein
LLTVHQATVCDHLAFGPFSFDQNGLATLEVDIGGPGTVVYRAMLNLCIWVKTNAGQGSFYRSQHELIGVFPKKL